MYLSKNRIVIDFARPISHTLARIDQPIAYMANRGCIAVKQENFSLRLQLSISLLPYAYMFMWLTNLTTEISYT